MKFILNMTLGRTGSTLVNSIINANLKTPTISQEISFDYFLNILSLNFRGVSIEDSLDDYIQKLQKYIISSTQNKYTQTHAHYVYPYKWNNKIKNKTNSNDKKVAYIEYLFSNIFNCDGEYSGCKILIGDMNIKDLIYILNIMVKSENIHIIYTNRNFDNICKSRKNKDWCDLSFEEYEIYKHLFEIMQKENENISIINYENIIEDCEIFMNKIGISPNKDIILKTLEKKHSY